MKQDPLAQFNPSCCIASKIQRSNRIINNMFRKHLKPFRLSNSQVSLLFVLSKFKIISQRELSEFLHLEKSTVNRNITRLKQQNLIQKRADNKIEITEHGVNQVLAIIPVWEMAMAEAREKLGKDGMNSLDQIVSSLTQ